MIRGDTEEVSGDPRAKQALGQLKMYPYAQRENPPAMDVLDVGTRAWSGVPPRAMEYWQRVDDVIQREPIEPRDVFFHAMLRPLGLEKGKPFKPDAVWPPCCAHYAHTRSRSSDSEVAQRNSRQPRSR